jgi:hypothetical protein
MGIVKQEGSNSQPSLVPPSTIHRKSSEAHRRTMVADYHVARKEVSDKPKIEVADHG